jgi:hypothetical protein
VFQSFKAIAGRFCGLGWTDRGALDYFDDLERGLDSICWRDREYGPKSKLGVEETFLALSGWMLRSSVPLDCY